MPSVHDTEKLEQIYLPSTEDAKNKDDRIWVVMNVGPLMAADLLNYDGSKSTGYNTVASLVPRIKEWNLTQDGQPLPITFNNVVKYISMEDIMFLDEQTGQAEEALPDDEKKDSPTTSSTSETEKADQK